jgi:hypothetical protein
VTRLLSGSGVALVALFIALTGCGDPYNESRAGTPGTEASPASPAEPTAHVDRLAGDPRSDEPISLPPSQGRAPASTPTMLARAYARETANWDWRTLPNRLEHLRDRSAGALSAELTDAMRAAQADESLTRDHPVSEGAVVAVSVHGAGASRRLVVVTRERETASGVEPLGPATHRVYFGEARRTADGWRMVGWRRAP